MIIKGGSRAGPRQLAAHLLRTDTNERMIVLELQSGSRDLAATFRDWQTLSEGTRGSKGLYHVNIDPDARYTMTPQQWARAVDVLEKELGLEGQPRAVVMHEKHGREHIHVVWARTDIETMRMRSDSQNYAAHERASLALEQEFGHEHVPGKHAKRDREKQPEPPKAEFNHAEWQQQERTGLSAEERRAQIAALHRASDNGIAFKAALEEAGYILARGDGRDFVVVDAGGTVSSLGRNLKGVPAKELKAFMAEVDKTSLPSAAEAAALQRQTPAPEKSVVTDGAPAPAPVPEERAGEEAEKQRRLDPRVAEALRERQEIERQKWIAWHAKERGDLEFKLNLDVRDKLALIDQRDMDARERLLEKHKEAGADIWERLQRLINPVLIAERVLMRERERELLRERQFKERRDLLALELQTKELELEALDDRHAEKLRSVEEGFQKEEQTYLADQERAERLLAELEEAKQAEEQTLDEEKQADEDYQEEERLERERNPWDDDPIRRSK